MAITVSLLAALRDEPFNSAAARALGWPDVLIDGFGTHAHLVIEVTNQHGVKVFDVGHARVETGPIPTPCTAPEPERGPHA